MARLNKAPITIEAVARIDALFAIERDVNGLLPDERRQIRHERSRPRVEALGIWLREQHARLSPNNQVAKAIAYSLNAWDALVRFLDDGHLCITNNAAERSLRCIAVGRNNWTFAGSDAGGRRAAAIYTLIETAKLDDVDPGLADRCAGSSAGPPTRPSASTSCCPGAGTGCATTNSPPEPSEPDQFNRFFRVPRRMRTTMATHRNPLRQARGQLPRLREAR